MLVSASQSGANDSGIEGVGGRWRFLRGEHPNVRMVSERVELDVYERDQNVRAAFVFHNDGAACSVKMGFPESGFGDGFEKKRSSFRDFATFVDGTRVPVARQLASAQPDEERADAFWVKTVRFKRGQTRRVTVSYRAPLGSSVSRAIETFASYQFTGGNWRGLVSRSDLMVRLHAPGTWAVLPQLGETALPMNARENGQIATFSRIWRNWQAQADFNIGFTRTVRGWMSEGKSGPFGPDVGAQTVAIRGAVPMNSLDYAPPALWRRGRAWLQLRALSDRLSERYPSKPYRDGVELQVFLTGETKTNTTILELPRRRLLLRAGKPTMLLQEGGVPRTLVLPAAPFVLPGRTGAALYVPAEAIAKLCGAEFKADPARHTFRLTFATRAK